MMNAVSYLLLISSCLLQWSGGNAFTPVVYPAKSLPSSQCGQSNPLQDDQQLMETLKMIRQQLPPPGCNPPTTCAEFLRCNSSASSGYYQIQAANGSAVQVYCDMEGTHCGGEGGWMRVAHLNMTDPSSQCPVGFRVEAVNNKTFCIRHHSSIVGCASMLFEPFGLAYSKVCGNARGYGFTGSNAFSTGLGDPNQPLNGTYVDGVSITYGSPFTHIWTYASGLEEKQRLSGATSGYNCPCNIRPAAGYSPPSYVGSNYYCESGFLEPQTKWATDDPLWDGNLCREAEVPCCNHTGLPWFHRDIVVPTTATIQVRLCNLDELMGMRTVIDNIGIERLELYVK